MCRRRGTTGLSHPLFLPKKGCFLPPLAPLSFPSPFPTVYAVNETHTKSMVPKGLKNIVLYKVSKGHSCGLDSQL